VCLLRQRLRRNNSGRKQAKDQKHGRGTLDVDVHQQYIRASSSRPSLSTAKAQWRDLLS
jgi:hypothetical protein